MQPRITQFQAIGTAWTIAVHDVMGSETWTALCRAIRQRIAVFDSIYSRFRPDSLVSALAARAGTYTLPEDARPLLTFYRSLYDATGGLVTPLIGQALADAGYDAQYSLTPRPHITPPPAWDDALHYAHPRLTLKRPVLLDVGAAGKGYLVDIVSELIAAAGVRHYAINAGGDMLHRGPGEMPLRIGLEDPSNPARVIGVAELSGQSLCASAGTRRAWRGYQHILNPRTLQSPTDIIATWVIAGDTMTADGVATALFFVPPRRLAAHFQFSYAMLGKDMQLAYAPDFPVTPFIKEAHA